MPRTTFEWFGRILEIGWNFGAWMAGHRDPPGSEVTLQSKGWTMCFGAYHHRPTDYRPVDTDLQTVDCRPTDLYRLADL